MRLSVVLLITVSTLLVFVNQAEARKPGRCPIWREPNGYYACAPLCRHDGDCPGVKKCCMKGCGRKCVHPHYVV